MLLKRALDSLFLPDWQFKCLSFPKCYDYRCIPVCLASSPWVYIESYQLLCLFLKLPLCVCVAYLYIFAPCTCCAQGSQNRASDILGLELHTDTCKLPCCLKSNQGPLEEQPSVLNCWAISPAPNTTIYDLTPRSRTLLHYAQTLLHLILMPDVWDRVVCLLVCSLSFGSGNWSQRGQKR